MPLRIDAHHHFWDPARANYPWLTDDLAVIKRSFGPSDLEPLVEAARVAGTVLVQTRGSEDETMEFLALADATAFIAGVVGWTDLTAADAGDRIERLRQLPGGRWLRGIRHQVHDEADPAWLERPDVRSGLRAVAAAGLTYDLLVRTRELPAAASTAAALPELCFVVDHLAKPPLAGGDIGEWAAALEPFRHLPNVSAKLSGLVTEADWQTWGTGDLRPAVDVALDVFGPARLVFGSDWPVCLLAARYEQVVDAAETTVAGLDPAERDSVFGGNAMRIYRLEVDG